MTDPRRCAAVRSSIPKTCANVRPVHDDNLSDAVPSWRLANVHLSGRDQAGRRGLKRKVSAKLKNIDQAKDRLLLVLKPVVVTALVALLPTTRVNVMLDEAETPSARKD